MVALVATLERSTHLVGAYLGPVITPIGITQGEAHVLAQLVLQGPLTVSALHREFGHKRSTLTNILNRLEERGFVRRALNQSDRRSLVIHLTAAGRRPAATVTGALDRLEGELRSEVSERDLAGLEAVVQALEALVSASL